MKISHIIMTSSFTWLPNFPILTIFLKSASKPRSSTLPSLPKVWRINCLQKSSDLKESNWKQREFSWFCKFQQIRRNFKTWRIKFWGRSVKLKAEFWKTNPSLTLWMQQKLLQRASMSVFSWQKSPVSKSIKLVKNTEASQKEAQLSILSLVTWVSLTLCINTPWNISWNCSREGWS